MSWELRTGHVLDVLAALPEESVSCVVTSPPYWSLRKYDAPDVVWGGDAACEHDWQATSKSGAVEAYAGAGRWQHEGVSREETPETWTKYIEGRVGERSTLEGGKRTVIESKDAQARGDWARQTRTSDLCARCGAWRGQLGLEPSPWLYVEHIVAVMRAVRRVLRKDGVCWLNIGTGYASGGQGTGGKQQYLKDAGSGPMVSRGHGFKPKDLIPMHAMLELALIQDGWWLRSEVIWHKPNAMPESVRDRPTDAHEYVLLLTKSARYWWDAEAVREAGEGFGRSERFRGSGYTENRQFDAVSRDGHTGGGQALMDGTGRNLRSVWRFPTAQSSEAHFATFPIALPLRCIAGACPREVCTACGKARVRIVERQGLAEHPARANRKARNKGDYDGDGYAVRDSTLGLVGEDVTTGWSDCGCGAPFVPGVVLDPFAGLATTGLAALRLGRRFVGIELSEKYADMARQKLSRWWEDTRLVEGQVLEGQLRFDTDGAPYADEAVRLSSEASARGSLRSER